jgi:DNA repair protein RecO (recombination protein O)
MAIASTQGIVLHQVKYGDTSLICQIYTEDYGRKSFLFKGIRSKKSKIHPNILQALFIVKLEAYFKEGKDISLVKDASAGTIFTHFPYDIKKSAQAMFMAEVLNKCLREEESNRVLFSFIMNSIEYFDLMSAGSSNFHILFLVKLSKHLGFYPSVKSEPDELIFDMQEGIYKDHFPGHQDFIDTANSGLLDVILNNNYDQLSGLELNRNKRNELLDYLLKFYSIHIEGINRLKSYLILREIFS